MKYCVLMLLAVLVTFFNDLNHDITSTTKKEDLTELNAVLHFT